MNLARGLCCLIIFLCLVPFGIFADYKPDLQDPLLEQWNRTRDSLVSHIGMAPSAYRLPDFEMLPMLDAVGAFRRCVLDFRRNPAYAFMVAYDGSLTTIMGKLDAEIGHASAILQSSHSPQDVLYAITSMQSCISEYMYYRIAFAEKINRYYIFIILLFVAVCIVTTILVAVFRKRLSSLERNEAHTAQFARTIINVQEGERIAIARELHDTLAQDILYIKVATETMQHSISRSGNAYDQSFARLVAMETECINRIRGVCSELRPPELVHLCLKPAVTELCGTFSETTKIDCRCFFSGEFPLGYEEEINCYRIIQESLNNIRKHSRATGVEVEMRLFDRKFLRIRISDNGIGIPRKELSFPLRQTFGLQGMRERVRMLNGTILIGQGENGGTEIAVSIPLTGAFGES